MKLISPRSHPALRNGGMTLFECMCALAVLTVLVSVLSQTFISTTRLSAASNRALDRVRYTAEIRDAFSAAVREAGRVADGVQDYKTGGDCLVLELSPAADTGARRYAVLRRTEAGKFVRLDIEERDGVCTTTYLKTYALWTMAVRFKATADARLVSMEMDVQNAAQSPNRPAVVYRYSATMRSMLRGEGLV
jgi:prepilin-type N-terminal cleavage/methylation domain-containing protein